MRIVTYSVLSGGDDRYTTAALSIGEIDGSLPYVFSRIIGAYRYAGGILVADGTSGELRHFDIQGRHLRTVGGQGSGPGEFQQLRWASVVQGDSAIAWDLRYRRFSYFDDQLRLTRTVVINPATPYVVLGVLSDGAFLVWPFGAGSRPTSKGPVQSLAVAALALPGSDRLDTLFSFPAQPSYLTGSGDLFRIPFTVEPSLAVSGEDIWIGDGNTGELRRYARNGVLSVIVRLSHHNPISSEDITAWRAANSEHTRQLGEVPVPKHLPVFDRVQSGSDHRLWVRLFPRGDTAKWLVLNRTGEILGRAVTPLGELQWEDAEGIVLRERDSLGVERIVRRVSTR